MIRGQQVVYRSTMRELWPAEVLTVHADGLVDVRLMKTGVGDAVEIHLVPTCGDNDQRACIIKPKDINAGA